MAVIKTKIWANQIDEFQIFLEDNGYSDFILESCPSRLSIDIAFRNDGDAVSFRLKDLEGKFYSLPPEFNFQAEWRYNPGMEDDIAEALGTEMRNEIDNYIIQRITRKG